MTFTVTTKNSGFTFENRKVVNISSKKGYDCTVEVPFEFLLTLEYNAQISKYVLFNKFNCTSLLFKGQPLPQRLEIDKMCKIMVKDSDEFITIKIVAAEENTKAAVQNQNQNPSPSHRQPGVSGDKTGNTPEHKPVINSAIAQLEKQKTEIEKARVAIIKQISFSINDLKHKISMNSKAGIFLHIGLFVATLVLSFGVSNYFCGLPLKEAGNMIQMPVNMKFLIMFTVILYGIAIVMKQGMYLLLQNRLHRSDSAGSISEKTLLVTSSLFYAGVYIINVLYYIAPGSMQFFSIAMSLFFTAMCVILALACGYFKSDSVELSKQLNKYEYREDFEHVMQVYRSWIERFVNNLSAGKIRNMKDKLFSLQLKSTGEIILGILTAPFLAYGVSNTLAACFPDAAGWVRISGLRFSPVFLVLATFLIIFAFFSFVNGFLINKKIQASNVLKNDGFSNYMQHGTDIFGLQGVHKLDTDMRRSFIIGLCIIFIEFSMNISYFMQEIGADLNGILLSCVAALVPTALLIAETFMLSQTKFETYACAEVLSKYDGDTD